MLHSLKLLFPALIPSWRFFDQIAPSPRLEYALLCNASEPQPHWQPYRPQPKHVSPIPMLWRVIWNPKWNETLFVVSCAERLLAGVNPAHSEAEILYRLKRDHTLLYPKQQGVSHIRFRLLLLSRQGQELLQEVAYMSLPKALANI